MDNSKLFLRSAAVALLTITLAACGGGGDDDGGGGSNNSGSSGGGNNGGDSSGGDNSGGSTGNSAPVSEAGPQQNVKTGALVRLDGSQSRDADGDLISYEWMITNRPSGSRASLENANSVRPLFTPDRDGRYSISLVASDSTNAGNRDRVIVIASSPPPDRVNSVPVADAGRNQSVKTSSTVNLDGSASTDSDGDPLAYRWGFVSRPSDSDAELSGASTQTPSFSPDEAGEYVVQLVVNDGTASSSAARVTVRATTPRANAVPEADAGEDQSVSVGDTVELDGTGSSDADGDDLSYSWTRVSIADGSGAELNDADTATPTFVADATGSYVLQLNVTDSSGRTASDRVVISAGPRLDLEADLGNDGSFEDAELPYDETLDQTVVKEPSDDNGNNGFVLGRFKVTAVGGDLTLNFTAELMRLNDSTGNYAIAIDNFQDFESDIRQAVIPDGRTVTFTVNAAIPEESRAFITYGFTVVETGVTFEAGYTVESDDLQ